MRLYKIPHITFCSGMTRSASGWSYETCQVLEKLRTPADRLTIGYMGETESNVDNLVAQMLTVEGGAAVFLSHIFGKRAIRVILSGIAKNVYTYRDPRDSIASSMRMDGKGYEFAFNKIQISLNFFDLFYGDGVSLVLKFSEILTDPLGMTRKIADYLGFDLSDKEVRAIHMETERSAIERRNQQRRSTAFSPEDEKAIDRGLNFHPGLSQSAPKVDNPWRYSSLTVDQYADATERLSLWLVKMNFSTSPVPPWLGE